MNHESPAATPAELFLTQLRERTSTSHKNLEKLPVSASILAPNVTELAYAHYLELMHDVVADTESRVFNLIGNIVADTNQRRKLPALTADLKTLGIAKNTFNRVFNFDGDVSAAFALGIFYVVEGSSLGGRFIMNNINCALGFDENRGGSYFAGYGNKTGSMWKQFLNTLTQYESDNDCGDEIIAGADFAFNAIHNHFLVNSQA